jgi:cytochrome c-type biogenesis protein CcmE
MSDFRAPSAIVNSLLQEQQRALKQRRHWRIFLFAFIFILALSTVILILSALRTSVIFFYGPSEAFAQNFSQGARLRLGGLVVSGSLVHEANQQVRFHVTDGQKTIPVKYIGFLPDLFREGQGVVIEGSWENDHVRAAQVLAKHDEKYMPPEVANILKKEGHWKTS